MSIEAWRPMREMRRLTDEMERLMEESFGPYESRFWELPMARMRAFPVNLYQKNNDVVVEASMPGIRPEEVDVNVSGRTLTIKAERKESKEIKEDDYYCREVVAGRFFRQLTLPTDVQADKGEAHYENGMLRLRLPLAQATKEVPIKIKAVGEKAAGAS